MAAMDLPAYPAILWAVADEEWAILPSKLRAICDFLATKSAGGIIDLQAAGIIPGGTSPPFPLRLGDVALIPVWGTLIYRGDALAESSGVMSTERIGAYLAGALADSSVRSIVLDINSPGGVVPGVGELAAAIRAGRETKKIVAYANPLAASAAYWIASACSEIVCLPSGQVGSIGVFTAHEDLSKALEAKGVSVTLISAGKHKVEGNPLGPLTPEAKAAAQSRIDASYATFVRDVAHGRNVPPAAVRNGYGEGRILSASDALAAGMVDRLGTLGEAIARASNGSGKHGPSVRADVEAIDGIAAVNRIRNMAAGLKLA